MDIGNNRRCGGNPSVSLRSTAPLTQGSLCCGVYSVFLLDPGRNRICSKRATARVAPTQKLRLHLVGAGVPDGPYVGHGRKPENKKRRTQPDKEKGSPLGGAAERSEAEGGTTARKSPATVRRFMGTGAFTQSLRAPSLQPSAPPPERVALGLGSSFRPDEKTGRRFHASL